MRPRLSPDGTRVAFASALEGAMDLDLRSGDVRRLTVTGWDDSRPAWSPDGTELVFQSNRDGSRDLWILTIDDGTTRRLTQPGHIDSLPGWTDIYTVDVTDGRVHEVLSSEFEDYRPAWSGDGRHIVFASDRSNPSGLWVVPTTGGEPQTLLRGALPVGYPDWSLDGTSIIYLESTNYGHLSQASLGGTAPRRITPVDRKILDRNPDVSPDGSFLAYETSRVGNEGNVVVRTLSTGEERRLSSGRINDGEPRFSPDGNRLVFTRGGGDFQDYNAVVRDLDSGTEETWTDMGNVRFPTFCGKDTIVFGWADVAYTEPLELWRQVRGEPAARLGTHLVQTGGLECDADGTWVVASLPPPSGPEAAPRLVRIALDSGEAHALTRGDVPHLHPRLSPDGQRIAFVADAGEGFAAYSVPVSGGGPELAIGADQNAGTADRAGPDSLIYSEVHRREAVRMITVDQNALPPSPDPDPTEQAPRPAVDAYPRFSPDGSRIAFY